MKNTDSAKSKITTKHLSEVPQGIIRNIATAMVARHGEYTYVVHTTGEKVRVVA
jgi:hypothetical protein